MGLETIPEPALAPITRVPADCWSSDIARPSCLDFVLATPNLRVEPCIVWDCAIGDHTALRFSVPFPAPHVLQPPRTWIPDKAVSMEQAIATWMQDARVDCISATIAVTQLQHVTRDSETKKKRHSEIFPDDIRAELEGEDESPK